MEADDVTFRTWRQVRRLRLWLVVVAAVAALALGLSAVAIVTTYARDRAFAKGGVETAPGGGRRAAEPLDSAFAKGGVETVPAGGRRAAEPLDLASALRMAAGRLAKVQVPSEPDAWKTPEYQRAKTQQLYRDALAAGVPVLCLGECKEITLRVAAELQPTAREEWLRAALRAATKPRIHSSVLPQLEEALSEKYAGAYLHTGAETIWETVYNLSADAALRLEARGLWEAWATKVYVEEIADWERCRADPHCIPGLQPARPEMPEWNATGARTQP